MTRRSCSLLSFCIAIAFVVGVFFVSPLSACTTVLVSGRATPDGRPLLWKNRDTWQRQNEVLYDSSGKYAFVGVVNAEASRRVWMGSNEAGFCIENSLSRDLSRRDKSSRGHASKGLSRKGIGNGSLIRIALETCATVGDFEELLNATATQGRTTQGNFGVIDADGNAVMFEVGPISHKSFDANDPKIAPGGFIVRANSSITGKLSEDSKSGTRAVSADANAPVLAEGYSSTRYKRAFELCESQVREGKIDIHFLLQQVARDIAIADVSGNDGQDLSRPLSTSKTLNRNTTVSSVVFHGVRENEPASRTTMWTLLGEPAFSIAVPNWAAQGNVARALNGHGASTICQLSTDLRSRNYQIGNQDSADRIFVSDLEVIQQKTVSVENTTIARTLSKLKAESPESLTREPLWELHTQAADDAVAGLTHLCQVVQKRNRRRSGPVKIAADFQFDDPNGTRLADAEDASGNARWNGGLTNCATKNGCLRIRRNEYERINRFVDLNPNVRATASNDGAPKIPRGWIVMEVTGWNLLGEEIGEAIRIGFASRDKEDIHTAGLEIRRQGADTVTVRGVGFGDGSTDVTTPDTWPTKQVSPITFVLELDKITGNSGEGDAGGVYRLYARPQGAAGFKAIGAPGKVRRLRNGNHMALHVEGYFGDKNEFLDIGRISFTTTNPMQ